MIQIRIHGLGGQGAVTAAEILAIAGFKADYWAQAFPSFGVERAGAPVEAYVRLNNQPIRLREQIHQPDYLIVLDDSLVTKIDLLHGCSEKTSILINTNKAADSLGFKTIPQNLHLVDAKTIAMTIFGKNLANTVILGAFAKASNLFSLKSLEQAITEKFKDKGPEMINKNLSAIRQSYAETK